MNRKTRIAAITLTAGAIGLAALGATAAPWGPRFENCPNAELRAERMAMMAERGGRGAGMPGRFARTDLNLSAEQVRTLIEARLIMHGNGRLKVGEVARKDEQTYLVDIVTVDDSLVRQVEVDKDTGPQRGPGARWAYR